MSIDGRYGPAGPSKDTLLWGWEHAEKEFPGCSALWDVYWSTQEYDPPDIELVLSIFESTEKRLWAWCKDCPKELAIAPCWSLEADRSTWRFHPGIKRSAGMIGLRWATFLEAGFVWAPYVPLQVTPVHPKDED